MFLGVILIILGLLVWMIYRFFSKGIGLIIIGIIVFIPGGYYIVLFIIIKFIKDEYRREEIMCSIPEVRICLLQLSYAVMIIISIDYFTQ